MTNAAPQQPTTTRASARGISIDACDVVLLEGALPVAVLSLSLADDNVHELRVRVELPERCNYTLRSRLYATSVEHVSYEGRSLPLDADLQVAVCAWCEGERVARLEIEAAWERAVEDERKANLSYLAAE